LILKGKIGGPHVVGFESTKVMYNKTLNKGEKVRKDGFLNLIFCGITKIVLTSGKIKKRKTNQ